MNCAARIGIGIGMGAGVEDMMDLDEIILAEERELSTEGDKCECNIIHADTVMKVRAAMPGARDLYSLSELYKSLGDPTRLGILFALSQDTMCVCDIAALLKLTQSAVSHQLRVLRNVRLVKFEKRGKSVYYSLDDDHVKKIFEQGLEHVGHTK